VDAPPLKTSAQSHRWDFGGTARLATVDTRLLFFVALVVVASGLVSPPMALAAGLAFGLVFVGPLQKEGPKLAKTLLQLSVVALGFGMNLHQVLKVGRSGFLYTAVSITATLAVGILLGRLIKVDSKASFLIATGTAICGGSAIAAIAPVLNATEEEISVSMGTIFLLNSVALFVFPAIGAALHLSQSQFGLWAALAIHDTSSVVGAGAKYGDQALIVGTTVKLARALWIIPASLATAIYMRGRRRSRPTADIVKTEVTLPWFIFLFCLASISRSFFPHAEPVFSRLAALGKTGLTVTLFLIGTGLSRRSLKRVGFRPLIQGVSLWAIVATLTLLAIYRRLIAL
jgi:uncharacterized integral membrane protein (TIGR00698 family)